MKKISVLIVIILFSSITACSGNSSTSSNNPEESQDSVILVTHDSFAVSDTTFDIFTSITGIKVQQVSVGDTGQLISSALLTSSEPLGDVLFGIDNTFLSRGIEGGIFEAYISPNLQNLPTDFSHETSELVTPIDYGHVCINYWIESFNKDLEAPKTLDDLIKPAYADLLVVQNPETSSPGLAFLLSTISKYGERWQEYWEALRNNGVSVTSDWESSYYGEFIAGGGDRPIVVSYASSPVAELIYADPPVVTSPTAVIKDSCFKQIEYAGILSGSKKQRAAQKLIDFMLTNDFQDDIPLNMFMMPVSKFSNLPPEFDLYEEIPDPIDPISSTEIQEKRNLWTEEWTNLVLR